MNDESLYVRACYLTKEKIDYYMSRAYPSLYRTVKRAKDPRIEILVYGVANDKDNKDKGKIKYSDTWACKDCRYRGDRFYMIFHIEKKFCKKFQISNEPDSNNSNSNSNSDNNDDGYDYYKF